MTSLRDLLTPEALERLKDTTFAERLSATAKPEDVLGPIDVAKMSLADRPVTTINGVEVDLEGDALYETECADCDTPLAVEIAPKGVDLDLLINQPRVAVCEPCGKARVKGKRGTLVHPKPTIIQTEETPVFDLNKYTPAQLAGFIQAAQEALAEKIADDLPAKRDEAIAAEAERVAADEEAKAFDRAERKVSGLPEFTLTHEGQERHIPHLDLSAVTNLDEVMSAKARSPYNKALYLLGMPLLEAEKATYRFVADVHTTLMNVAGFEVPDWDGDDCCDDHPPVAEAPQVVAVLDADVAAKAKAIHDAMPSLTAERALEIAQGL